MQARRAKFLEGNLFRHVTVMSLTGSVGLMAVFIVDLMSMLFISMLARPELAAAIGYGGTIMFLVISFGIGMSVAAGAVVAMAVGAGDAAEVRSKTTHSVILSAIFGVIVMLASWALLPLMVSALGATGEVYDQTIHFLAVVILSVPFLKVGMVGGAILRAHGDARRSMSSTLWGAGISAILNPVLILWADMDLTGAAIATIASRIVIAGVATWQVHRFYKGFVRTTWGDMIADVRPISRIAVPAILAQIATPLGYALVTRAMSDFGEAAVAGMAIAGRLTPVAFGVIFALAGSIGPIIGQNHGARRPERVRAAFFASLGFAGIVVGLVSLILFVLRAPIADAFHAEGLTRELVYLFCGPLAALWYFIAIIFVANAAFNNLGRPFTSTWTNWVRSTIGTIIPVWIGARMAGAIGVMWGQAFTGVVFGLLSLWLALRLVRVPPPAP
ncbi:MATE family efflux transporter [Gemmobacter nectariphilus]|uniref:MATE family efflux transporter n=1 Tax=Gemmobacter nectariphilus TaxID=220343 RepID=UPI0003FFD11E|nr:MATE family efflux transporter [Gemmobacter nectariphilus]